jgi:hypothetical protein
VFFEHGPIEVVEAESGEHARKQAGPIAKVRNTVVKKIKRVR